MAGGSSIGPGKDVPGWYQIVGSVLAISSGLFIGISLILQKKALLKTDDVRVSTGNEYAYLKSRTWWIGIGCMILGEFFNFTAYAFTPAIIVTPLGAISVVVSAILSFMFLGEKLNFSGVCGIILCIIGSVIIVFHGPPSTQTETIDGFFYYVLQPGFIIYTVLVGGVLCWLLFRMAPLHGSTQPFIYLSITSLGGAFLVNAAQGFGSSIVYSMRHWNDDNQFWNWKIYPLGVFVICTAVFQVLFLNKSLLYFSTSIITPINYVFFSTATLVTSAVLFQGFNVTSFVNGATILLGFSVIVIGVALLFQYNLKLNKLAQAIETPEAGAPELTEHSLHEEVTDKNPFTLMSMTYPFRRPHRKEDDVSIEDAVTQEYLKARQEADDRPISAADIKFLTLPNVLSTKTKSETDNVSDTSIRVSISK